jgi:hypothetical protein
MKSGIFAVANIGEIRFYIGEVHHLHTRWRDMLGQLQAGTYPDSRVQTAWTTTQGDRRFTFHTADSLRSETDLLNRERFFQDLQ